jgi:hypothetical protein
VTYTGHLEILACRYLEVYGGLIIEQGWNRQGLYAYFFRGGGNLSRNVH